MPTDHVRRRRRAATALGVVALAVAALVPPRAADADETTVTLTLSAPERIEVGDRVALTATVRLAPPNDLPLLLTPSAEGTAVDVVRGRLLRANANDPDAAPLVFRIPLVARGSGTAVVRVEVLAYACDELCHEVRAGRTLTLRVHPR